VSIPSQVQIIEVGPRDGLQFEAKSLSVTDKVALINKLADCGLSHIEAGSFVAPDKIPQLADTDAVFQQLAKQAGITYTALVPNEIGMQRAMAAGVTSIAVFTAVSDTFCQRNIGCNIDESFERFKPVITTAKTQHIQVRGYLSCIAGCPYEGAMDPDKVVTLTRRLYEAGCDEISLGDTIGVATPAQTEVLLRQISAELPIDKLAVHFHDTRGQALANILACLEIGIYKVDASVAGLGGCPYARGASGNVATEDVVYMLHGMGIGTGIDLAKLIEVGRWISQKLQRDNSSRVGRAGVPDWFFKQYRSRLT